MKTVVVLQPSYIPWLGYFDQMSKADTFVFYDDVQFDKHGWRNRNRIKSPKGEPYWLTIPVRHSGKGKPTNKDIEIDSNRDWRKKHLETIRQFYRKAPFLDQYFDEFSEVLSPPETRLSSLNYEVTAWMSKKLGVQAPTCRSSELGIQGGQSERLLDICSHFEATHYLSGSAAREYLDMELFKARGIEVLWHDYVHPSYPQLHGEFVPFLSALDLLMNVGPESQHYLHRTQ